MTRWIGFISGLRGNGGRRKRPERDVALWPFRASGLAPPPSAPSPDLLVGPIGRASCWERVCQYVLIPVVADSFKKKLYSHHATFTTTYHYQNLKPTPNYTNPNTHK